MALAETAHGPGESVNRRTAPEGRGAEIVSRLVAGDKAAWDGFVSRYSPVIYGAVYKILKAPARSDADAMDVAQDVFLRLCKDDFRLLRRYEPERASLTTWLTVVATSAAVDFLRRKRGIPVALDDMPEEAAAVDPVMPAEKLKIPDGLLSPRQALVMQLIFERDMDATEVAEMLGIEAQTVRSMQHKALVKLRRYFGETDRPIGDAGPAPGVRQADGERKK